MKKDKIAKSFNLLYQSVVNDDEKPGERDESAFKEARDYISAHWKKLDLAVMEFLAVYMMRHPEGKVQFVSSDKELLDLYCREEDSFRVLSFNSEGVIVRDRQRELVQKGE